VKCNRSLAVYTIEFIAHVLAQRITKTTKSGKICYLLINRIQFKMYDNEMK